MDSGWCLVHVLTVFQCWVNAWKVFGGWRLSGRCWIVSGWWGGLMSGRGLEGVWMPPGCIWIVGMVG